MTADIATGPSVRISIAEAAAKVDPTAAVPSVPLFQHGTMLVKYYAPQQVDRQTPHTRDEVYVVARGRGTFMDDTERRAVGPGDLLFVAAGRSHRFEDFTPDFGVWVVFYGPDGGENA